METYEPGSENILKVITTQVIDGVTFISEKPETREEIERQTKETEEALAIHDSRREEFVARLEMLCRKREVLDQVGAKK